VQSGAQASQLDNGKIKPAGLGVLILTIVTTTAAYTTQTVACCCQIANAGSFWPAAAVPPGCFVAVPYALAPVRLKGG
jgi:hypothetical protein